MDEQFKKDMQKDPANDIGKKTKRSGKKLSRRHIVEEDDEEDLPLRKPRKVHRKISHRLDYDDLAGDDEIPTSNGTRRLGHYIDKDPDGEGSPTDMLGHTADRLGHMADELGANADEVSRRWRGKADRVGDNGDKWGDRYKNIGRLEEKGLDEFADSHDGIGEPGGRKKKEKKDEKKEEKKEEKKDAAPAAAAKIPLGSGPKSAPVPAGAQVAPMPTISKFIEDPTRDFNPNKIFAWPQESQNGIEKNTLEAPSVANQKNSIDDDGEEERFMKDHQRFMREQARLSRKLNNPSESQDESGFPYPADRKRMAPSRDIEGESAFPYPIYRKRGPPAREIEEEIPIRIRRVVADESDPLFRRVLERSFKKKEDDKDSEKDLVGSVDSGEDWATSLQAEEKAISKEDQKV